MVKTLFNEICDFQLSLHLYNKINKLESDDFVQF